jgi:hypothetical protein
MPDTIEIKPKEKKAMDDTKLAQLAEARALAL